MPNTVNPAMNQFTLPGFGLPLNFKPSAATYNKEATGEGKDLFPNSLDTTDIEYGSTSLELTTIREFTMLRIMNQLTDRPDWHNKVFDEADEENESEWKAEILEAEGQNVTEKMVDWCLAELCYKAALFKASGAITVYDADVVKSDTAIPQDLKQALRNTVKVLEDIPSRLKHWRPGSDGTILDLVHPSLFPLVFGRSRILQDKLLTLEDCIKRTGEGTVIPVPPVEETRYRYGEPIQTLNWRRERQINPFSRQFQWLPCDIELSDNGQDVKIASYINGLHPYDHRELYGVLEQIIARTIPLWNQSLTGMKATREQRITYRSVEYDPDPEYGPRENGPQRKDGEDGNDYWERREQWFRETRVVVLPEPGEFEPPIIGGYTANKCETVDIFRDHKERGIQVIVKLVNIHLTPEKPEYGGGAWQLEGQLNEHICATAVYYYDSENVTTSSLAFRQQVDYHATHEIDYRENQHE